MMRTEKPLLPYKPGLTERGGDDALVESPEVSRRTEAPLLELKWEIKRKLPFDGMTYEGWDI